MKDEDDEEDEYGLDCFLYWNGELLRPLEEDAAIAHRPEKPIFYSTINFSKIQNKKNIILIN